MISPPREYVSGEWNRVVAAFRRHADADGWLPRRDLQNALRMGIGDLVRVLREHESQIEVRQGGRSGYREEYRLR